MNIARLTRQAWSAVAIGLIVLVAGVFPSIGIVIRSVALLMAEAFHAAPRSEHQMDGIIGWLLGLMPSIDLHLGFAFSNIVSALTIIATFVGLCYLGYGLRALQELSNSSERIRRERIDAEMRRRS